MNQLFAFLPSLRILQGLGICPLSLDETYNPRFSKGFKFYSRLWIGLGLIGLYGLYANREVYLKGEKQDVGTTVDYLQLIGMRVAHVIILIEVLRNQKSLTKFFSTMLEIDSTMETIGIDLNFGKQKRVCFLLLGSALLFYVGTSAAHLSMLILRSQFELIYFYWLAYFIAYIVSCFRYFQVFNCIWFIKKRIELLNEELAQIELNDGKRRLFDLSSQYKLYTTDNKFKRRPQPIKSFERLILFRETYDKLYVLSTIVNYSFGLSVLVNIANDFVTLTANTYFVFLRLRQLHHDRDDILRFLESLFWCLPHLVNVITISAICHFTVQSFMKTALIIHKSELDIDNEQQNLFLEHFSLQLLHQKIQFSAFGFFNLDFTLLYTFVAALTTYLVILIQFYISEQSNSG